jgi:dethiobiotin synthetase
MGESSRRIAIAGTGTEIGKTWTAVRLIEHARSRGWRVAARKPAQSYTEGEGLTDAELLAAASGEPVHTVCPSHRWYAIPMAPPMAADVLGRPAIKLEDLLAETQWPSDADLILIETAGGLCSPIAHDADNLELIARLKPTQVILVADAGLGTLNSVRLCLRALTPIPTVVFLNRFEANHELHRRNRLWLEREGVQVVVRVEEVTGDE